jgi:hypothetical protein
MRNKTRNFFYFQEINTPGCQNITKNTFLVKNLPTGIPCQFKIKSFNNGGWSEDSEETIFVTPGFLIFYFVLIMHYRYYAVNNNYSYSLLQLLYYYCSFFLLLLL